MATVVKTTEKTKELQQAIFELINEKKVNMSTIARGINKSPATLSLYLKGAYSGAVEEIEADLKKYLQTFKQTESVDKKALKFVKTVLSEKLFNAASMCQILGKMGVCYGAPGVGKTTAILEYQKCNNGVVFVDPFEQTSKRAVLMQIADQLKLNYTNNMSHDEFTTNIAKKLAKNKHIIIVDEAENLTIDIFKIIRKIHDRTQDSCGVLFVGTYSLEALLQKMKNDFSYISSRIGYIVKLDSLPVEDVEKLVFQYFPQCDKNLIEYIGKSCCYNARYIQNLLDLCVYIMQSNNVDLNLDVIDAAREKLLI